VNADHSPDRVKNLLAFSLVGAFIALIPLFVYQTIPDGNKDIIVYMVGQLSGMALTALGFYFVNKAGQDALDAKRAENTGKLADNAKAAIEAATGGTGGLQDGDTVELNAKK